LPWSLLAPRRSICRRDLHDSPSSALEVKRTAGRRCAHEPERGSTGTLHWLPGRGRRIDLAHTEIAAGHLVERFRLFFIIALGETVLTMGTAFTDEPFELERLLALAIGFTGTVALWWCYFQRSEAIGAEAAATRRGCRRRRVLGHVDPDADRARADRHRRR
jgi:Bacterial low temperature requirement A protein (LtrA)